MFLIRLVYLQITIISDRIIRTWIDPANIPPIDVNGEKYSALEVIDALNYGTRSSLSSKLAMVWRHREDIRNLSQLWDRSLVNDFANELFNNRKDAYKAIRGINLGLVGKFEDYMASENVQLLFGVLKSFPGILSSNDFRPPNSFIIFDLISTIMYLKENIEISAHSRKPSPRDCAELLDEFWKGNHLSLL
jgi:hypothetical protein